MVDLARNSIALIISLAISVIAILGVRYLFFRQPVVAPPAAPTSTPILLPSSSPLLEDKSWDGKPSITPIQIISPPVEEGYEEMAPTVVLEADDLGFYPSSIVAAKAGSRLTLVFKIRTTNVYYGGLQIESPIFDTGPIQAGGIVSVDFVVPQGKTIFASYWPYQKIKKAEGEIIGQ